MKKVILLFLLLIFSISAFSQKPLTEIGYSKFLVVKVRDSVVYYEAIMKGVIGSDYWIIMSGSIFNSNELLELFSKKNVSVTSDGNIIWHVYIDFKEGNTIELRPGVFSSDYNIIKLPSYMKIYTKEVEININNL
jgi:hypothetical protein